MPESENDEVVKYYTKARKFPQLLGRMPDGTKIPGGPYTVQQLLLGIGILLIGGMTMNVWGVFGGIGNIIALFVLIFASVFALGRVPMNGRNPFAAAMGLVRAICASPTGRYEGHRIRIRRPRRLSHKTVVLIGPLPSVATARVRVPAGLLTKPFDQDLDLRGSRRPAPPAPGIQNPVPLVGIQILLAAISATRSEPPEERIKGVR